VKLAAALVAVICVAVTSAPAMAVAPPVLPSLLVARTHDLRGFGSAKVSFYWTASAVEWAHGRGQSEAEAKSETAGLLAQGFQEGAEAVFTGRRERGGKRREAVSDGYVFATVAGAEHFLRALVAESLNAYPKRGLEHFAVPSIPGAVGAGDFVSGRRGVTGNVFFGSGRCVFVVGNAIHGSTTRAEGKRAPIAAAVAIYARTKQVCA
jgi:hypothetical protein